MPKVKINNHRTAPLILRRKDAGNKSLLYTPGRQDDGGMVVIPPLKSGYCDFWDEIKNHQVYQNWLEKGKISIGEGDEPTQATAQHFTSYGDTLKAPPNLRQNDPDVEVFEEGADIQDIINDPGKSVVGSKRGRRAKPKGDDAEPSGQNFEQN